MLLVSLSGTVGIEEGPTMLRMQNSELDPTEVSKRHEAGEIQLVDVREQFEYDAGHVPGSLHLPMNEVVTRAGEIDKDKPVAFICLMGARSQMVADHFRAQGYDSYNVTGGFAQWFQAKLPTEPDEAIVQGH